MIAENLWTLSDSYWHEIENRFYEFDRMERKLKMLDVLKRDHAAAFVGVRKEIERLVSIQINTSN